MRTGWIKLHRQVFDNPVCAKDSEYFFVWCYLLTEAKYEEERVLFKNEEITLSKGQLLTTSKKIALELNVKESKVNRILKKLENEKQIERQTSNKNTLITVINWEFYQSCENQNEEQVKNEWKTNDKQMTDERQTNGKQTENKWKTNGKPSYYNKEYKNIRIQEDKEIKKERIEEDIITVSNDTVCQTQDVRRVVEAWNELGNYGIKTISRLSSGSQRYQRLCARLKQYGVEEVLSAIERIKISGFLQGENKNGWVITFDWFVLPNNFPKVLDGNFDNNSRKKDGFQQPTHTNYRDEQFRNLMEQIRSDEEHDG